MIASEMGSSARAVLDRNLAALREDILQIGDLVESAIVRSRQALRNQDGALAQEIIEGDIQVNQLRYEVEEACLELVATQQPAAGDLRAIVAAMNIVSDLERMGDHAAGIAKTVIRLGGDKPQQLPLGLKQTFDLVREMLRQALKAYEERDEALAYTVALQDDLIDEQYRALFRQLVTMMGEEQDMTTTGLYLMFAGHNLERIADRVTNIAERVIFMQSGRMEELNPEPNEAATN